MGNDGFAFARNMLIWATVKQAITSRILKHAAIRIFLNQRELPRKIIV